jgi:hypothetical protein
VLGLRKTSSLLGLALLAACGGSTHDFVVNGAAVVVRSDAAFTRSADFPPRVESTLSAALAYWGGTWSALRGATIAFEGDPHVRCGDRAGAIGCYDGDIRVSTLDAGSPFQCVEQTVLVHEVGHAVIGDPSHTDPRWMDFAPVLAALAGRPGYDGVGEVPCRLYASVWQHPPDP